MTQSPSIQLYYAPGAASFCVHWLLLELNLPHELIKLDLAAGEQKSPSYLKLNPAGVVPTLIIDDVVMTEAAAIVMSLADRFSSTNASPEKLAPEIGTSERMIYHEWMFRLANTLQPALRLWWYPSDANSDPNAADEVRTLSENRIAQVYVRLDQHLEKKGPFLLGEKISALDFYATMLMRWSRNTRVPADHWPHLKSYLIGMRARPSMQILYAREGLSEWHNA